MVSTLDSEKIKEICEGVWRDRTAILSARSVVSGESLLTQTVYWRLCKAGLKPGESIEDCAPYLRQLVRQYRAEAAQSG